MASEVDICNLALARLGDTATVASISPPEGSAQAEHCARFYPMARDALLELHAWGFATRRVAMPTLSGDTHGWGFAYAGANDAVRLLGVLPPHAPANGDSQPYEVVSREGAVPIVLTDQSNAELLYVARVVDTVAYSPLFVDALAWLLASHLAGVLLKGSSGAQMAVQCYQRFAVAFGQARASDANQRRVCSEHTPAWIAAR